MVDKANVHAGEGTRRNDRVHRAILYETRSYQQAEPRRTSEDHRALERDREQIQGIAE